jgi:hypothetical protein
MPHMPVEETGLRLVSSMCQAFMLEGVSVMRCYLGQLTWLFKVQQNQGWPRSARLACTLVCALFAFYG